MHFGFSYVGLVYLVMLMVPNILWTKNKPADYEKYVGNENKMLAAFERTGEVLTTALGWVLLISICAHGPCGACGSSFRFY